MIKDALYRALVSGHLCRAGFDVQENEPLVSSPLLSLNHFIAAPHIGGLTQNYFVNGGMKIVQDSLTFLGIKQEIRR